MMNEALRLEVGSTASEIALYAHQALDSTPWDPREAASLYERAATASRCVFGAIRYLLHAGRLWLKAECGTRAHSIADLATRLLGSVPAQYRALAEAELVSYLDEAVVRH